MKIFSFITLPALLMALVLATNVFTEIIKRLFPVKRPQRLVVVVACLLSVCTAVTAAVLEGWALPWMIALAVAAGVLLGGLIAYGAMFGYDDLYKQAVGILGSFVNYFWKNATPEPTDGSKETGHVSQPGA